MAPSENPRHLLEAVEENPDEIPDDTPVQHPRMEGARTGELPKGRMEGGAHAERCPHQQRNSPSWLYHHDELLPASK